VVGHTAVAVMVAVKQSAEQEPPVTRSRRGCPRDRWNHEHPEWKYQDYRGLRQAYHRTLDAVAYYPVRLPEWKPSAAVKKRAREALERAREIVELDHKHDGNKQVEL
jgi:hypothetical protein